MAAYNSHVHVCLDTVRVIITRKTPRLKSCLPLHRVGHLVSIKFCDAEVQLMNYFNQND